MKSVNILTAIRWVAKAWSCVKEETISNCFRKAGMLDSSLEVVRCSAMSDDEDQKQTDTLRCRSCRARDGVWRSTIRGISSDMHRPGL